MSFYFEKVYFPLIENILKELETQQSSKNASRNKKYSPKDLDSSQQWKSANRKENLTSTKKKQRLNCLSSQSPQDILHELYEDLNVLGSNTLYQEEKKQFKSHEVSSSKNCSELKAKSQKIYENPHFEHQQSLIWNASSYNKSHRLQTIFESSRKQKTQKSRSKSYRNENSHLKPISQITDQVYAYQSSRKNLRKSFCLKMVEDDEEWEDTCSKSLSNRK